jgi:hypothetical protein
VAGVVLLDTILQRLGAEDLTLCDLALREGLVLDYIQRNRKHIAKAGQYPDVRRRSVIELAERCSYWPEHASQVARLSLSIFDQTRSVHVLTDREREWLEFAALLHDIGTHISYPRHHKHSYYLIKVTRGFAGGSRDHRAHRAVSPQIGSEEIGLRLRCARSEDAPGRSDALRDSAVRRNARSQPRPGRHGGGGARPSRGIPFQNPHRGRRRAGALGRPSSNCAARARVGKTDSPERRQSLLC